MINEAILVGHVGKVETKPLKSGLGNVTLVSLATTTKYTDKQGEKHTRTTWHNVNCFHKLSEIAAKYVHVGDLIYIRGEIHNKKIEEGEKSGQWLYSVVANDIRFLPNGKQKNDNAPTREPTKSSEDYASLDDPIPF